MNESFFLCPKTEAIAALSVFEYIETWYNRNRRHSALNGLAILEFENFIKHAA